MWSSGKVLSDNSITVPYEGPELQSGTRYVWRVRVWDNKGKVSKWMSSSWLTGLFSLEDWKAKWIEPELQDDRSPIMRKEFAVNKSIASAVLHVTAHGLYEASINGKKVGDAHLTPGWTAYNKRLQYQSYDVTSMLAKGANAVGLELGYGWYHSRMCFHDRANRYMYNIHQVGAIAQIDITYTDGTKESITTDKSWKASTGEILHSTIYDGETIDARKAQQGWNCVGFDDSAWQNVNEASYSLGELTATESEPVVTRERVKPVKFFITPAGEKVLDFGQNLVGREVVKVNGKEGQEIVISHAEVLDEKGNFYTTNLRTAKAQTRYTCREGEQTFSTKFSWYGFRYLKVEGIEGDLNLDDFVAEVIFSDYPETGNFESSNALVNQLQSNIKWGMRGNFVDVPTDCNQRDERMGWTGDAQVFMRTATYNYDVRKFFRKWLADMALAQEADGWIPEVIPNMVAHKHKPGSAAWCDAVAICPWQLYWTYGEVDFLANQFDSMKKWVDYITSATTTPYMWTGGNHYDDWLGLDAPSGSYKGSTRSDLIATTFYAHSTDLLIRAGKILGHDMTGYEQLYTRIVAAFKRNYADNLVTQTEKVLAVHFHLTDEPQQVADALAQQIIDCGTMLHTGFVGTAYVMHALSEYGHTELAYSLLLRKEYPSWLFSVKQGATTVWEHWDGIREDGSFWSADMNSYNHYAYGSVADWVYGVACGIRPAEPGFARAIIAPVPDARLGRLSAKINTPYGEISCAWRHTDGRVRYDVTTCVDTEIRIEGKTYHVGKGSYVF